MEILNDTPFEVEAVPLKGPEGKMVLTIVVKGTFDIRPGEPPEVASEQIPVAYGDEFYDEIATGSVKFESDIAPFKPRADIVLIGKAYAPGQRAVRALDVILRVGELKKTIRVIGDRHWICSSRLLPAHPSKSQPFKSMDLVYERAFGGIDEEGGGCCNENQVGCGFFAKKSKKTLDGASLPNLEDPANLIKSWKDHPKPVGFGFRSKVWMPRTAFLGTYDDKWREERCPDLPEDFRLDFYNAAHPDLQVQGYLKGDEEVELVNLTPYGTVRFCLPRIRPSCVVTKSFELIAAASTTLAEEDVKDMDMGEDFQEADEQEGFTTADVPPSDREDVALNLDTLCLIPDEKRFYLVWRGLCSIKNPIALEVKTIEVW